MQHPSQIQTLVQQTLVAVVVETGDAQAPFTRTACPVSRAAVIS